MLYPKVVGQSGTASPAPVLVTNPPTKRRGKVATAVNRARRRGQGESGSLNRCVESAMCLVMARDRGLGAQPAVLGQPVLFHQGRAVLVRPAVDGRDGLEIPMRGRRGCGPFQGVSLPGVAFGLLPGEQAPEEIKDEN